MSYQAADRLPSTTQSDEQLALALQQGRPEELTVLVQRYHTPLFHYLLRMTNWNLVLAEDLVQETFLRVLFAIQHYRYPRPFRPWLYAVATNLVRDHFKRAETRYTNSASGEELEMQPASNPGPDQVLLTDEASSRVRMALSGLPEQQRAAIILRYYQDLSLQEISHILEIPVGTVKSRLSLGLRRLRSLLSEEGESG